MRTNTSIFVHTTFQVRFLLSPEEMTGYHAPYTVSPTDLTARRSTWEGEGHKTKTHACVTRAGCVGTVGKKRPLHQLDDFSCNGIFANVIYTHSARDVRVRLGLVALPFPSRASDDKIRGRYSIRRKVIKGKAQGACTHIWLPLQYRPYLCMCARGGDGPLCCTEN